MLCTGVVFIMGHKLYGTVRTPEFGLDRMQEQIVRKTRDFQIVINSYSFEPMPSSAATSTV